MRRIRLAAAALCLSFALLAVGLPAGARAGDDKPAGLSSRDLLDEALAVAGFSRTDLGWRARGWWDRYPQDIPYKLRHVDDLFEQPLATVPWLRAMGAEARDLLSPAGLAKKGDQGAGSLFRLVHDLGTLRRWGATRPYSANLVAPLTPLDVAIKNLFRDARRPTSLMSFGKPADWPRPEEDFAKAAESLPKKAGAILGQLIENLVRAEQGVELAFRRVPMEAQLAAHRRLDIGIEETDALDYEPAFDDVAHGWDEPALWIAGLQVVEALDVTRKALGALEGADAPTGNLDFVPLHIDVPTPYGRVIVNGTGSDDVDVGTEGAFLIVDFGGNDRYRGSVASSSPTRRIGALLDLSGDDVYEATDRAQGAGSLGVGVLLDAAGNDQYRLSGTLGQGAGLFGLGVLADLGGDDTYKAAYSAQGCGFFGVGLLLDAAGKDAYTLWSDGQGFGGVAGVGVLADGGGDDAYEAVVDPAITKRPSYHTEGKVTVSNAQGCGMGRRGDGSDGHSWGGGIGCLLDVDGNDTYTAANWCQGCGYWFGTGLLWDGGGNDQFRANGWASGSGAHFCIGCLVDESGDDLHHVTQNWGPGYGHDFTVGLCVDLAGNDTYEAGDAGLGWSINRSVAMLLDASGDDTYRYIPYAKPDPNAKPAAPLPPAPRPGTAVFDPKFLDRSGLSALYWSEGRSIGLFVDGGGKDVYPAGCADGDRVTDEPASDNARARNRGVRFDGEGAIDLARSQGRAR